jgi:hypothetical protein
MVIELGGSFFEITHDLVGHLFRAKNAGVTPLHAHMHHLSVPLPDGIILQLSIG